MPRPQPGVTSIEVREATEAHKGFIYLHRHIGEHLDGEECWCCPIKLTAERHLSLNDIQYLLDQHFAVH